MDKVQAAEAPIPILCFRPPAPVSKRVFRLYLLNPNPHLPIPNPYSVARQSAKGCEIHPVEYHSCPLGSLQYLGNAMEAPVPDEAAEALPADEAFANVRVPVDAAPKTLQAVVHVNDSDAVDSDNGLELPQGSPVSLFRAEVVSGREGVAGIQADPHTVATSNPADDCGQVLEAVAQACALSGRVLEQDSYGGTHLIQRPVQRGSHAREAFLFTGSHVRPGMQDHAGNPEEIGPSNLVDEGGERSFVEGRIGRRQVDEIAVVGYHGPYAGTLTGMKEQFAILFAQCLPFPLVAVFQKDLDCPASRLFTAIESLPDAAGYGHVRADE